MNDTAVVILQNSLANLLSSYLLGQKSFLECTEWFSTIDWGSIDITSKVAQMLGKLQLISTEVSEGIRLESEFQQVASEAATDIAGTACIRYWIPRLEGLMVSSSSNDNIHNSTFMPMENRELQSWSISPQVVSA